MRNLVLIVCLISASMFIADNSFSEPWLANRYSENCAGCHAPGRYNLPPKDRRCTLSCQGCHTNPNGGGMRSHYGKWNSDRWLRSFNWKQQGKPKERPLPWFAQNYISHKQANDAIHALENWGVKKKGKKARKKSKKQAIVDSFNAKTIPKTKAERKLLVKAIKATKKLRNKKGRKTLTESDYPGFSFSEFYFERANGDNNWEPEAKSRKHYESTIPYDDPYFLKKREEILIGLDYRYFGRTAIDNDDLEEDVYWPMALDIGLQHKPFIRKFDNFSYVIETRYFNAPFRTGGAKNSKPEDLMTRGVSNRSAYILIDDLVFNTFFMYGLYRPMFEHYTPDHTSLAQNILYSGASYRAQNKAITIGAAPNVPFANITIIQKQPNDSLNQEEGFIVNLGARWVTMGASLVASYKAVTDALNPDPNTGEPLKLDAYSVVGGLRWKKFIVNAELLNVTKEFEEGLSDSGTIFTQEVRYKVWKESYLELIMENSNVASNYGAGTGLKEGEASQMTFGYRFFPVAGVDLSLQYRNTSNKPKDAEDYDATEGFLQAHLYF